MEYHWECQGFLGQGPQTAVGEEQLPARVQHPVPGEGEHHGNVHGLHNGANARPESPAVPLLALEWENTGNAAVPDDGAVGVNEDDAELLSLVDEPGVMHLINELFPNV